MNASNLEAWRAIGWLALAIGVIGWVDVLVGLYPFAPGNPDWEFGAFSRAVDSLPLGTIGLGVAVAAAVARGHKRTSRIFSIVTALALVLLIGLGVLYTLSLPIVLKAIPAQMKPQVMLAMGKTAVLSVVYVTLYVGLVKASWGHARVQRTVR